VKLLTQVKLVFSADADPLMSLRIREPNHVHFVTCDTICQRIKRRRRTRRADPARTPPTGSRRPSRRQLAPMRSTVGEALKNKVLQSYSRIAPIDRDLVPLDRITLSLRDFGPLRATGRQRGVNDLRRAGHRAQLVGAEPTRISPMEFAGTLRTRGRYALSDTLDKHLKAEIVAVATDYGEGIEKKFWSDPRRAVELIGTDFEHN
jgi:hypothetical protein